MVFFKRVCFFFFTHLFFFLPLGAGEIKTIAFVQDNMANDFRKAQVLEAMKQASNYPHIKFVYSDAKGKPSLLLRHIEKFTAEDVDALIVGTNDPDLIVNAIEKAYDSGIIITALYRDINTKKISCAVKADNFQIGKSAANYLQKKLPNGGVILMLEGLEGNDVSFQRTQGFTQTLQNDPKYKIVARRGNYLRKDTILVMEELFAQKVHFDAIYSQSDSMLSGVRTFFNKHRLDISKIPTVGVDYIQEAHDAIREGQQGASIRFPLGAKEALEATVALLDKKPVPRIITVATQLITKENVEISRPVF